MKFDFISIGLITTCIVVVVWVMLDTMSIPDVWVSYTTNECVKVLNYAEGDNFSCENLPVKFNHVWVK